MRLEVSGHAADGVCFAEDAGESLPRGEDSDGRLGRCGLCGQTASVRRGLEASAAVRRAWREGRQRTAARVAMGCGGVLRAVVRLLRLLQLLLMQLAHLGLSVVVDWIAWGVMCGLDVGMLRYWCHRYLHGRGHIYGQTTRITLPHGFTAVRVVWPGLRTIFVSEPSTGEVRTRE